MIRVNLLPHREEKRKRRQQQFQILAGISAVIALLVGGAIWLYLDTQVTAQRANVAYMKQEIDKLDKQIEEIRKIREETASLLAKKQVVEGSRATGRNRSSSSTSSCASFPRASSSRASSSRAKVNISGYAQSNARVSTLMRNLGASPYLENPELVEIKAVPNPDKSGSRVNEFNMNISIKRARADDGRSAPAKGAAPGGAAAPAKPAGK
jgi:type IV pilus assembly protein PilN